MWDETGLRHIRKKAISKLPAAARVQHEGAREDGRLPAEAALVVAVLVVLDPLFVPGVGKVDEQQDLDEEEDDGEDARRLAVADERLVVDEEGGDEEADDDEDLPRRWRGARSPGAINPPPNRALCRALWGGI